MRNPNRPDLSSQLVIGLIPMWLMVPVVFGGQYLWFIGASPVAIGSLVLVGGGLCVWLGLRLSMSQRAKIEQDVFKTGDVVYSDALMWDSIIPLVSVFYGVWSTFLFQGTVGTTVALPISTLGYILLGSILVWMVWMLVVNFVISIRYIITRNGIWCLYRMVPFYLSFEDIELVYYRPGFRILFPSYKDSPVVRFNQYVVVELKKEVKLHKESHRKHLTPSDPQEFLSYLPQELIRTPDQD